MKIIGESKSKFILESEKDEVARIVGHYSASYVELKVGQEIKVSELYRHLYELSHRKGELGKVSETLRAIASLLEVPASIVEEISQGISEIKQ